MTFPIHLHLFGNSFLLHAILEWLGIFVGYRFYVYLRKNSADTISDQNRLIIFIGALIGAIVGSRLIGGLENIPQMLAAPNKLFYFYANKTILGGLLFGIWGVEIIKKGIGEKQRSGDLMVFPLILAMIIGRIGCFSMGVYEETYGLPVSWGIDLGDGIHRHPVALYEIAFLLMLATLLFLLQKKSLPSGAIFQLFSISYLFFRLVLDCIKPHYNVIFSLSTIQITCLVGLVYYAFDISRTYTKLQSGKTA